MAPAGASPLAERIHDRVLQLLGTAMLKSEMCETLGELGRADEIPAQVGELRDALQGAVVELRSIMSELRQSSAQESVRSVDDERTRPVS